MSAVQASSSNSRLLDFYTRMSQIFSNVPFFILRVEPDFEPLFLSMSLYDAKEKRKISENFYCDLNSDMMKRMLQSHVPYADMSTLTRSCIFNISSNSAQDLFLVIRVCV